MFSQKNLTVILIIVIGVLAYQTVAFAQLSSKLNDASIRVGASSSAINLTDNGAAPQMVGGC